MSAASQTQPPAAHLVTLLALFGPVSGITTSGLTWPLADASLAPGSTRGVSNVVRFSPAIVSVSTGTLLAISPEARS
jgi:thiamine pyrophosphokinase